MPATIEEHIDSLELMTTSQLLERFTELHGYSCHTRHRQYLIRKIAWRIQANAEGDLSERARRRAAELAVDAEIRVMAPRAKVCPPESAPPTTTRRELGPQHHEDGRLPAPGSAVVREYKGRKIRVTVLPKGEGFEWQGERYRTLSAVAKAVTGSHINGFRFFGLGSAR